MVRGRRAFTNALNAHGIRTARRGDWHATPVRNLIARKLLLA